MKSILDRSFPYRPSHNTDVRVTWDKRRKEMEEEEKKIEEQRKKVEQLPRIGRRNV